MIKTLALCIAVGLLATGCVSKKKYASATGHVQKLQGDSLRYEEEIRGLRANIDGLQGKVGQTSQRLAGTQAQLAQTEAELQEKARRMDELSKRLEAQNNAMTALRTKVADALVNFKAEDLTVSMKDGKVYVSLSEQLLFKSGSAAVDPKGEQALGQLATVLNANPDISVMVEGHTDTVPIATAQFKDNWDLSTARAASIVRLLTKDHGLDPRRVTAAGRGEFMPVASNEEEPGRARNRRTEIILIPRLEELYELIGQQ